MWQGKMGIWERTESGMFFINDLELDQPWGRLDLEMQRQLGRYSRQEDRWAGKHKTYLGK